MKMSTRFISEEIDPATGAIVYPIYQTSAFLLPMGEKYRYSRESNPTTEQLANKISEIEGTEAGTAFSSGMGAITSTLLSMVVPGSRVLVGRDVFARTYKFITGFLSKWGVKVDIADPGTENIISKIREDTDFILIEGITNPVLRVNDIPKISKRAREAGAILAVDSTFATPVNQKPAKLGADIVIHSASKFISGHNDVIAGVASGKKEHIGKIDEMRRNLGSSLDPHAAFLVLRGLKTLKVRMDAANKSAFIIAKYLEEAKGIKRVFYPGLESHPDHDVARSILNGYGGVVSFEMDGDESGALRLISKLDLITSANTLGGVNSTISHPKTMSHRGLSDEERSSAGISKECLRLSVGLEDTEDLIKDISNAIQQATSKN